MRADMRKTRTGYEVTVFRWVWVNNINVEEIESQRLNMSKNI
jgi:hypothetical protein